MSVPGEGPQLDTTTMTPLCTNEASGDTNAPQVSVLILVGRYEDRCKRAVASLLRMRGDISLEILLVDIEPKGVHRLSAITRLSPAVRVILGSHSAGYGHNLALGMAAARAPLAACVEEHTAVAPDWAQQLVAAFADPAVAVVGPRLVPDRPPTALPGVSVLEDPAAWVLGKPMARVQNCCYRKERLAPYVERLADLLNAEATLHGWLRRDGYKVLALHSLLIAHSDELRRRDYAMGKFFSGWNAMAARSRLIDESLFRRVGKAFAVLLLWPLTALRWLPWRHEGQVRTAMWRAAPLLCAVDFISAVGMAMGLLLGSRRSSASFLAIETNAFRRWRPLEEIEYLFLAEDSFTTAPAVAHGHSDTPSAIKEPHGAKL